MHDGNGLEEKKCMTAKYFQRITFIVIPLCNSIFFFFLVYDSYEHDFLKLVVVHRTFLIKN
jgi:hypothetical protein